MVNSFPGFILLAFGLFWAPLAEAKTFEALPGKSRITYTIVHPWHEVEGVSRNFDCRVELSDDTVHSHVEIKVPILSFSSGNGQRDAKVLEIVDAFQFPFAEFTSDSIQRHGPYYQIFGRVNIHGNQKPIQFLVVPRILDGVLHIIGEFNLKLSDFKVERPSFMFTRTHDDFHIDFDLVPKPT